MQASKVETLDGELIIQGFREDKDRATPSYVFLGQLDNAGQLTNAEYELTPENAHIASEEIRKHAEFAASAEQGV